MQLLVAGVIAAALVFSLGIDGHLPQTYDFLARNAIYAATFGMPSKLSQFFNTFHYFLIASLGLSLLVKPELPWRTFALTSAVLAALHPMCAAAVLPWVTWRAWQELQALWETGCGLSKSIWQVLVTPEIIVGSLVALISLIYYMSGDSNASQLAFFAPYGPELNAWGVFLCLSGVAINVLPLLLAYKISRFKPLLFLARTLPFIQLVSSVAKTASTNGHIKPFASGRSCSLMPRPPIFTDAVPKGC